MPFLPSKRDPRRILLVEFNPYQILVAEISLERKGESVIEAVAEFDREDVAGFDAWIEDGAARRGRATVICSLVPLRGIVQRESVQPALLAETGYLEELVLQQQKGRFLTATPFKVSTEASWTFRTVNAVDGTALPPEGSARPALICAMATGEIIEAQQRLAEHRLVRARMESGLVSLFGAIYTNIERRGDLRAVVVVVILESVTAVYILGKEGVHTPNPVLHGLNSIVEIGRKELGATDDAEVLVQLHKANPLVLGQADKLVRRIARDLKPVVDSFEMTTGRPVDEVLCAYLPPSLVWIAEPLARSIGRQSFAVDCSAWMPAAGLRATPRVPALGPHWLGALSVAAQLPEFFRRKRERGKAAYQRPWHVECSVLLRAEDGEFATRRFLAGATAAALAAFALAALAWQLYALKSLREDTAHWQTQLAGNRKLFEELNVSNATLKKQSDILERAYDLMAEPFQLSELLVHLGRTIPPRMRVDRIETNDTRMAISGALLEPAEEASASLGRYMDVLRHDAGIGPLFSSIAITTLQRKAKSEEIVFELTLRLNRTTP